MVCPRCGSETKNNGLCSECIRRHNAARPELLSNTERRIRREMFKKWWFWVAILLIPSILAASICIEFMNNKAGDENTFADRAMVYAEEVTRHKETNELVFDGKSFSAFYAGINVDAENRSMSKPASNTFAVLLNLKNKTDETVCFYIEDVRVDENKADTSDYLGKDKMVTLKPREGSIKSSFIAAYGEPGDILNVGKIEFRLVCKNAETGQTESSGNIVIKPDANSTFGDAAK